MRLSRNKIRKIRNMKHQTRKKGRGKKYSKKRRRRRTFRNSRFHLNSKTLRKYGGGFIPLLADAAERAEWRKLKVDPVKAFKMPILILEKMSQQLKLFYIGTKRKKTDTPIYTPDKMQKLPLVVYRFLNKNLKELKSIYENPNIKWSEGERAIFPIYKKIIVYTLVTMRRWYNSKNTVDKDRRENKFNYYKLITDYSNNKANNSKTILSTFVIPIVEMYVTALSIFYDLLYHVEEKNRQAKLALRISNVEKIMERLSIGDWTNSKKKMMNDELIKLWGNDDCRPFTSEMASIIWRSTQNMKIKDETNEKLLLIAMQNIFSVISANIDIIQKNKECKKSNSKKSSTLGRLLTPSKLKEKLPNLYTALLIQSIALLWKIGGKYRCLVYMFFPNIIMETLIKSYKDDKKYYDQRQKMHLEKMKQFKSYISSDPTKTKTGIESKLNDFYMLFNKEIKMYDRTSGGIFKIWKQIRSEPAKSTVTGEIREQSLNNVMKLVNNLIEEVDLGRGPGSALDFSGKKLAGIIEKKRGGGDISTLSTTKNFSLSMTKGIAGAMRRLTRFYVLLLSISKKTNKQLAPGGPIQIENVKVLAQMGEPPRMFSVGFDQNELQRCESIKREELLKPDELIKFYKGRIFEVNNEMENEPNDPNKFREAIKDRLNALELVTTDPNLMKWLLSGVAESTELMRIKENKQLIMGKITEYMNKPKTDNIAGRMIIDIINNYHKDPNWKAKRGFFIKAVKNALDKLTGLNTAESMRNYKSDTDFNKTMKKAIIRAVQILLNNEVGQQNIADAIKNLKRNPKLVKKIEGMRNQRGGNKNSDDEVCKKLFGENCSETITLLSSIIASDDISYKKKMLKELEKNMTDKSSLMSGGAQSPPPADTSKFTVIKNLKLTLTPEPLVVVRGKKCNSGEAKQSKKYSAIQLLGGKWWGVTTSSKSKGSQALEKIKSAFHKFPGVIIEKEGNEYPNIEAMFGNICDNNCIERSIQQYLSWTLEQKKKLMLYDTLEECCEVNPTLNKCKRIGNTASAGIIATLENYGKHGDVWRKFKFGPTTTGPGLCPITRQNIINPNGERCSSVMQNFYSWLENVEDTIENGDKQEIIDILNYYNDNMGWISKLDWYKCSEIIMDDGKMNLKNPSQEIKDLVSQIKNSKNELDDKANQSNAENFKTFVKMMYDISKLLGLISSSSPFTKFILREIVKIVDNLDSELNRKKKSSLMYELLNNPYFSKSAHNKISSVDQQLKTLIKKGEDQIQGQVYGGGKGEGEGEGKKHADDDYIGSDSTGSAPKPVPDDIVSASIAPAQTLPPVVPGIPAPTPLPAQTLPPVVPGIPAPKAVSARILPPPVKAIAASPIVQADAVPSPVGSVKPSAPMLPIMLPVTTPLGSYNTAFKLPIQIISGCPDNIIWKKTKSKTTTTNQIVELVHHLENWDSTISSLVNSDGIRNRAQLGNSRVFEEMLGLLSFVSDNGEKSGVKDVINNTCYVVSRTGITKGFHNEWNKRIKQLSNLFGGVDRVEQLSRIFLYMTNSNAIQAQNNLEEIIWYIPTNDGIIPFAIKNGEIDLLYQIIKYYILIDTHYLLLQLYKLHPHLFATIIGRSLSNAQDFFNAIGSNTKKTTAAIASSVAEVASGVKRNIKNQFNAKCLPSRSLKTDDKKKEAKKTCSTRKTKLECLPGKEDPKLCSWRTPTTDKLIGAKQMAGKAAGHISGVFGHMHKGLRRIFNTNPRNTIPDSGASEPTPDSGASEPTPISSASPSNCDAACRNNARGTKSIMVNLLPVPDPRNGNIIDYTTNIVMIPPGDSPNIITTALASAAQGVTTNASGKMKSSGSSSRSLSLSLKPSASRLPYPAASRRPYPAAESKTEAKPE